MTDNATKRIKKCTAYRGAFLFGRDEKSGELFFVSFFGLFFGKKNVYDDAEDEGTGDGGDGNLTDSHCHAADTRDEDNGCGKEICIVFKVYLLDHLETGDGDEAVKGDAYAAHYAAGDGIEERNEGRNKGDEDSHYSGSRDGNNGRVLCDGNAADGFAVCGVGAAAEDGADDGAYAVTEERSVETGLGEKVLFDDAGEILVVSDMLREYNESNGNVRYRDGCEIGHIELTHALDCVDEGEFGNGEEGLESHAVCNECLEGSEINDSERGNVSKDTDNGKHETYRISCKDTDDEGDEFCHFFAVCGYEDDNDESYDSANEGNPDVGGHNKGAVGILRTVGEYILYSRACKRKTDERNGGADYNGGHKSVDPVDARELYDNGENNVNKTRTDRTDDESEESELHGNAACESSEHGADEGEGGAEEYGASELREELVNERTCARAEESRGCGHAVAYDSGNRDRCSHNSEELLESEHDDLTEFRPVINIVDKFHLKTILRKIFILINSVGKVSRHLGRISSY